MFKPVLVERLEQAIQQTPTHNNRWTRTSSGFSGSSGFVRRMTRDDVMIRSISRGFPDPKVQFVYVNAVPGARDDVEEVPLVLLTLEMSLKTHCGR